jgi:hypothetical protein
LSVRIEIERKAVASADRERERQLSVRIEIERKAVASADRERETGSCQCG